MRIAFLGLGSMGKGMAHNILRAGLDLTVWNRSRERADGLEAAGARVAVNPADAVSGADVAITMVADDRAMDDIAFGPAGFVDALPAGAAHLSMSTLGLPMVQRLAAVHAERGHRFVCAPVFGRPEAAAAARLFIVAAGEEAALAACDPLLAVLGQRTFVIGGDPTLASVVKLAGNFLIASAIESLGEAVVLTRKAGVDPHVFVDLLTSTLFDAPIYKIYGGIIADQRYTPPGFAAPLGFKDLGLVLDAARELRAPMPAASLVRDQLLTALAQGLDDHDWSVIAKVRAADAGL